MKLPVSGLLCCAVLLCSQAHVSTAAQAANAALARSDLRVELRQMEEGRDAPGSYSAGKAQGHAWEPQSLQVRNGERALLRLNDAIPMQWTQSVSTQSQSGSSTNFNANPNPNPQASASHALVWFDAGQSLSVQARWPGGSKPVVLLIEVQRAAVEPRMGADLPRQTRNTLSTTVTLPLAEWVTIAASGRAAASGVYSSDAGLLGRRLLQVRVMVP